MAEPNVYGVMVMTANAVLLNALFIFLAYRFFGKPNYVTWRTWTLAWLTGSRIGVPR